MKDTTTGANIFSEVLHAFVKFGSDRSTLGGIATYGARAMSGRGIGFVRLLKSALKVRWLSKGNMLRRFYKLGKEAALFKKRGPTAEMKDESWLCDLSFLVDITTRMNELNTRLQRKAQYASEMYGHIKGFMNKLRLRYAHIQNANLSHFPTLKEMGMRPDKKTDFANQLEKLFNEFSDRFDKDLKSHQHLIEIFSSSFYTDIDKAPTDIHMELIDLQERSDLKAKYVEMNLGDFYRKYLDQDKFPNLGKFMASEMALFAQLICVNNFLLKWVS